VALIGVGSVAQPVVDVEGCDGLRATDPNRDVEEAGRVAAAREQYQHGTPCGQEPLRGDAVNEVLRGTSSSAV
jgi:hypothetical protein